MARIIVAVVAVTAVLSGTTLAQTAPAPPVPQPPAARPRHADRAAGVGEVRHLVRARRCADEFNRGIALLHSFWFSAAIEAFNGVLKQDPALRDGALGHRHELVEQPVRRVPLAAGAGRRPGGRRRGHAPAAAAPTARRPTWRRWTQLYRDAATRDQRTARRGLREGHGGAGREVPRRRRGAHLLCAGARPDGAAHRQDLRQPAEGGGDPRRGVLAPARSSGPGALHHPQLRRAAAGLARAERGPPLRDDRARRARTRSTCRRTRSRAWACGRSRSTPTSRRPPPPQKDGAAAEELHALDYQVYAYLQTGAGRGGEAHARP